MATPLLATTRIRLAYQLRGEPHNLRAYAKLGVPSGGVNQVVKRDGTSELWTLAGQGLWDTVKNYLSPGSVDSNVVFLETLSGTLWNIVDSLAPIGGVSGGATFAPASQLTLVVRDTGNKKIRVEIMEGGSGYAGHSLDGTGIDAHVLAVAQDYTNVAPDAHSPYEWQVSRSNLYIGSTIPLAGVTLDKNDKIARRRGLA